MSVPPSTSCKFVLQGHCVQNSGSQNRIQDLSVLQESKDQNPAKNSRPNVLVACKNPLKLVLVGAAVGASMELFMISTGFYEKVVVIEAQRRAEQVEATEELVLASQSQQQQQFRQEMMPSLQSTERQL